MEWTSSCCSSASTLIERKRAREESIESRTVTNKRGCDEPMSWWNCLMLGINSNQSRIVKKQPTAD